MASGVSPVARALIVAGGTALVLAGAGAGGDGLTAQGARPGGATIPGCLHRLVFLPADSEGLGNCVQSHARAVSPSRWRWMLSPAGTTRGRLHRARHRADVLRRRPRERGRRRRRQRHGELRPGDRHRGLRRNLHLERVGRRCGPRRRHPARPHRGEARHQALAVEPLLQYIYTAFRTRTLSVVKAPAAAGLAADPGGFLGIERSTGPTDRSLRSATRSWRSYVEPASRPTDADRCGLHGGSPQRPSRAGARQQRTGRPEAGGRLPGGVAGAGRTLNGRPRPGS